jgi:SAM-dependent methyltransferase
MDLLLLEAAKLPQSIRRSRKDAGAFYDEFFSEKDRVAYQHDPRMMQRRDTVSAAVARLLPSGGALLDAGCGLGDILESMPAGIVRHGVDYSQKNVEYVSRRLGDRAVIRHGSLYDLPFPDGVMDAAICLEVLEHLEDDRSALAELSRVVRPGGWLIASVPSTRYWPQYLRLIGHYRHYTRDSFTSLLADSSFVVTEYLPSFPRWHVAVTRRYVAMRALAIAASALSRRSVCPYTMSVPGATRSLLQQAIAGLRQLKDEEASMDYSRLPTSTFVVARRAAQRPGDTRTLTSSESDACSRRHV